MSILFAIMAGASIVIARNINSILAKDIGTLQGTLINFITGLLASILFFFISGESLSPLITGYENIPFIAFLGGFLGVLIVVFSNILTPKLSAFYLTLFIFIGQLFTGLILDYIMFKTLPWSKLLGIILVTLGLAYNLYVDKKELSTTEVNTVSEENTTYPIN